MKWLVFIGAVIMVSVTSVVVAEEAARQAVVLRLPPTPSNPRNSEGDFVRLNDGRILFVYTHFTGGGGDHSTAHLAGRFSSDDGRTWDDADTLILENNATQNIMSVSLLRLADDRIAMFYLRKQSLQDCRPVVRFSDDEAKTWTVPTEIIPDSEVGYYVLNNDRVIQLHNAQEYNAQQHNGRLVVPVALHHTPDQEKPDWTGRVMCYLSDDAGKSWQRSKTTMQAHDPNTGRRLVAQEPGVVQLHDDRVMMFVRSNAGSQLFSHSHDGGDTWSPLTPSTLQSPTSPATIERIPESDSLVCVWNDHANITPELRGKRTPLSLATSSDGGATWSPSITLFDNPDGWYCYTALEFTPDAVLLGHCAGDRTKNNGLAESQITRLPWSILGELRP
ncbi:Sialidase A precursor [Stieleria maiorica]|uniref:Sialidase A n=1 Tax=Stieleria maiorica TaxID=2795974 RepID=A0A5B9MPG0_9BACT|nr:sialidase family protein [Stieleria maiorica]QEG02774.1 Sialidase A precursor [Stieleria maiorica]